MISKVQAMMDQVERLQFTREVMQHRVDCAIRNGEEIEPRVTTWLKKVDEAIEVATNVREVREKGHKWWSIKAWPKLVSRHQLSRKVVQDIGVLLEEYSRFEKISHHLAPQVIVSTRSMGYVDFESRMSTVKKLMEALRDDNIHVIGVFGMLGVGKTMLVREVVRQVKEKKLFDEVAIANVSHSPDLRRTQGEIADMLNLKIVESSVAGRAIRLRERLTKTKDKKILVIFDDIWENLDLEAIGIPYKGCKVLLISRNRDVLISKMSTQKNFGLEVLPDEEAWSLFEKMAGDCVKNPILRSIATEVAKECGGLPLALVTVSKTLKNKELFEWKDALYLLRRPNFRHLTKMQLTIYSSIELSYKHLQSKEVQDVFLLCAQQGYYIRKMDLLKYCYGLGLFQGISAMEDARIRLDTILRILKDCSLLLQSPYSSESLCMHDVVRDAATWIASWDYNMFVVRSDGGLIEWPDVEALKRCMAFFVRGGDIHELPNEMECPELRLLCMGGGDRPWQISDTFFEGMGKLRVLDLTKMQLSSLPVSLCLLRNLQTLCLDHQYMLGDIAVIGELKNLVILSLLHSDISQLPREIKLLTRLRLLDLSNCSKLEVIPPNVLSSLVALEELYMGNSFVQWEAEGLSNERNNASLAELKHLSYLNTLEIHIRDTSNLPKDLLFEKLERYIIFVGDVWDWSDRREEVSRTLKLKLNTGFQSEVGIKMLLKRTESLYLDELKGVKSVLHELDREGFQQLKHLHIQNNHEIKYIINSTMLVVPFPALETILLKNMTGLEEICHGQLPMTSFCKLRVVKVEHCDKLKFVFSSSIAKGLSQLVELEIRECSIMGAIVMREEGKIEDEYTSLFPQLHRLVLEHLPKLPKVPKLKSFLSTQNSLVIDAGEIMSEGKHDYHMPILHEQDAFDQEGRFDDIKDDKIYHTGSSLITTNSSYADSSDPYVDPSDLLADPSDLTEEAVPQQEEYSLKAFAKQDLGLNFSTSDILVREALAEEGFEKRTTSESQAVVFEVEKESSLKAFAKPDLGLNFCTSDILVREALAKEGFEKRTTSESQAVVFEVEKESSLKAFAKQDLGLNFSTSDILVREALAEEGYEKRTTSESQAVVFEVEEGLKSLQMLYFSSTISIRPLLESLYSFEALTYLNLSRTGIRSLPESIVRLVNLNSLILSYCHRFMRLLPKVGELKKLRVLDLKGTKIMDLPKNPNCPVLSTLSLQRNHKLRTIPPSFFDYMPALQTLDLSRTGISSLPESIVKLVSLKRLFLSYCHRFMRLSPKVGELKQLQVLDLEGTEIMDLPKNPNCPVLSTLFLQRNPKLRTIPPLFFDYMPALQTLNLSRTGIRLLPESIVKLVSLKRLILSDCHRFMRLSPKVGELKQLQVLDLEGTEIMDLPVEINKLTNLTCLKFSCYGYMDDGSSVMQSDALVPCGLISALSHLEELIISVNPDDKWWNACVEDIVTEVCTLQSLNTLVFYFPKVELVRHFISNSPMWVDPSLSNFRVIVGHHVKRIMSRLPCDVEFELERWERCLKYINGNGVAVPREIKKVLQYSTAFFLERHATVKKLSDFGIGNMKQLKCCVVGECNEVEVIIDEADVHKKDSEADAHEEDDKADAHEEDDEVDACEEDDSNEIVSKTSGAKKIVLGSLEYLCIYYMKNLGSIWKGPVQPKCLSLLKSLTLLTCPQMTTIFTKGLLDNLYNLEELTVDDCPSIKTIVSCEVSAEHKTSHFLPNLKRISLHYMPKLDTISSGLHIAPRLEWLSLYNCPILKNPLIEEVSSRDLKKIKGERSWWEALEWRSGCPAYLDDIFVPINIWDC